jgi:hypothetical protein
MTDLPPLEAYEAKRDSIYDKIDQAGLGLGDTDVLQADVTGQQGAYLVAWRHPEYITGRVEEVSAAVGEAAAGNAITYNRDSLHTTLSDHLLAPDLVIDPAEDMSHADMLDSLAVAVKRGLDSAGARAIEERRIDFDRFITNGKAVLLAGRGSREIFEINAAVKAASADIGINNGEGLHGSWGDHMTVNRMTARSDLATAQRVANILSAKNRGTIGRSVPHAIDVGYLAVSQEGFTFTTFERFALNRE